MLARGERLTELLKQPQYKPFAVEEQVGVIYAGTRGYLDPFPTAKVSRFQDALLGQAASQLPALPRRHPQGKGADAGSGGQLKKALDELRPRPSPKGTRRADGQPQGNAHTGSRA